MTIEGQLAKHEDRCPNCGDVLLTDSKFCRHCGEELRNEEAADVQFLCSKYSALIARLREEVQAHQQSQAELRLLERRLRDESQCWAQEKQQLVLEQQSLLNEIASLKVAERRAAHAESNLAVRELNVEGKSIWQHEAQQRQHAQMMELLKEHSELQAEQRDTQEELSACQQHLSRWRRKANDLEGLKMRAESGREEAERKASYAQEEMRRALRSASVAKTRHKEAKETALKEESQARDLQERLKALRHGSRVNARRADGAFERLATAEAMEERAYELQHVNTGLRQQLLRLQEEVQEMQARELHWQEAEQRAEGRVAEVKGELQVEGLSTARLMDLEAQLVSMRGALKEAEEDHVKQSSWTQRLGRELADARAGEQEAREQQAAQALELREASKRLSGWELARSRKRLLEVEEVCQRQEAELSEERQARERCHLEALKSTEKLRLARAQGAVLKERLRRFEEAQLRYPSRCRPPERLSSEEQPRNEPRAVRQEGPLG